MMGAAGFEPATAWSEATYSVQTELSALISDLSTSTQKLPGFPDTHPARNVTGERPTWTEDCR